MSVFLEILKCILCCEDESIDIDDNRPSFGDNFSGTRIYNTFSSLVSNPSFSNESYSTTRNRNYSNSSLSSSLINSTRNESTRQSRPSDVPVEYRVVLGSETNTPTSIGSLYLKSVERVYQGPQNSRSSGTDNIYSSPTSIKPPQSSTKLILPPPNPSPSSFKPPTSSPKPPPSSKPSSSSPKPPTSSPKPPPSSKPSSSSPKPPTSSKPSLSSPKPPMPSKPSSSSLRPSSSFSTPTSSSSNPTPSLKPTLSQVPSNFSYQQGKGEYKWANPKDTLPIYMIPKDIEDLIKRDIVPEVLKKPLSPSTYQDYFTALLYAEDYYIEKWSGYELVNVSLELHSASIYQKSGRNKDSKARNKMDDKTFVVFEVDSIAERRPFLLSRDFVFAQPAGKKIEPYKGIIYRVEKSTNVLVEFGEEFYSQHASTCRYNISFSFNRVCLKRAHQAIAAASDPLFQKFLFPNSVSRDLMCISTPFNLNNHNLDQVEKSAVHRILNFGGPPPFLVKGPLCTTCNDNSESLMEQLSRTGLVVKEAVLQIYQRHPGSKILVCAPTNSTCDVLMRSLKKEIPVSDMFRANAAFREIEGVPFDILPSCLYKTETECFSCPSLQELRELRVIFSTFISSYRLYNAGISAGHFSYILLVDASSATEPETIVTLANLADESTTVIVTGASGNRSSHVRADIARRKGLRRSYFERLCEFGPYKNGNSMFIAPIQDRATVVPREKMPPPQFRTTVFLD
ncbi:probable RNA helicase SDE3 [Durio zibethinus]|uniref:Probable RNA helicase SDE3 n=1 Tax=Durio zibethinus TaxID=66656 RepID=A0A6P5YSH6_DURZI|nr:probable RNA helicase SDE3 [Durio zibethinus]XP_022743503.1 probable RNA helicase SDE3 [Durio zibethinus]